MRIAVVTKHCCIRVLKQASVLREQGHELWLISQRMNDAHYFDAALHWTSIQHLENAIKTVASDVDLFHVHNEPTFPASIIRKNVPDAKIILDVHDSNYWRHDESVEATWYEFDLGVRAADAYVFPSYRALEKTRDWIGDKPATVVRSMSPLRFFHYLPTNYSGGLVSQGGHATKHDHKGEHWRDYGPLYEAVCQGGKHVMAFSSAFTYDADQYPDKYYLNELNHDNKLHLGKTDHMTLLKKLGEYDWNLTGNNNQHPVWDVAMPNKLFDAIAAGTPTVNFGCPEIAELLDEHEIGMTVESVEELLDRWDEHLEKRENLWNVREKYTMEHEIPKLEQLYKQVRTQQVVITEDSHITGIPTFEPSGNGQGVTVGE